MRCNCDFLDLVTASSICRLSYCLTVHSRIPVRVHREKDFSKLKCNNKSKVSQANEYQDYSNKNWRKSLVSVFPCGISSRKSKFKDSRAASPSQEKRILFSSTIKCFVIIVQRGHYYIREIPTGLEKNDLTNKIDVIIAIRYDCWLKNKTSWSRRINFSYDVKSRIGFSQQKFVPHVAIRVYF